MKKRSLLKSKTLFVISFILGCLSIKCFAQMPPQYRGAVNQVFNQQMMNNVNRTMTSNLWLNNINYLPNSTYKFEVRFSKDSIQNIGSKIYTDYIS